MAEASCLDALQSLFPGRDSDDLRAASTWLQDNFGVETEEDLDDVDDDQWNKAMSLNRGFGSPGAKVVLLELFKLKLGECAESPTKHGYGAEEQPPSASDQPSEATVLAVLERMFPDRSKESLEKAAEWLETKLMIETEDDLKDDTAVLASQVSKLVAEDVKLDASVQPVQKILEELFAKLLKVGEPSTLPEEPPAIAASAQPAKGVASDATAEPLPEDSVLEALQKLFVGRDATVLEEAQCWLADKLGVEEYADFEDFDLKTSLQILSKDDGIGVESTALLKEFFTHLGGTSGAEENSGPAKRSKDDYDINKELGEGAFATVYSVTDRGTQEVFALKEIFLDKMPTEQVQKEVSIHKTLQHPHILRCYDSFETLSALCVLLELAVSDLYHFMRDRGHPAENVAARLFAESISALHYLHVRGLMHRDIKPENILLDSQDRAKLGDFGCCTEIAGTHIEASGTVAYMSPEMAQGQEYDHRVDVWAMGFLLYEMLLGYSPFSTAGTELETKRRIINMQFDYGGGFNPGSRALLQQILKKDPEERLTLLDTLSNAWLVSLVGEEAEELASSARKLEEKSEAKEEVF